MIIKLLFPTTNKKDFGQKNRKSLIYMVAGIGFEPMTFGL